MALSTSLTHLNFLSCVCQGTSPNSTRTATATARIIPRARRASPRTNRLDNRTKKTGLTTTPTPPEEQILDPDMPQDGGGGVASEAVDDGYFLPELPGDKPSFWEGPQWNGLGFFVQYQWAFGIGFALIACGIAVATYNEGATDFKKTPVYKESIQSRELLEDPDASNYNVFEANPTEDAPSLD